MSTKTRSGRSVKPPVKLISEDDEGQERVSTSPVKKSNKPLAKVSTIAEAVYSLLLNKRAGLHFQQNFT